eukprot:SAG22_NODE_3755_length_1544_cov_0.891349_2_plen_161_part_00
MRQPTVDVAVMRQHLHVCMGGQPYNDRQPFMMTPTTQRSSANRSVSTLSRARRPHLAEVQAEPSGHDGRDGRQHALWIKAGPAPIRLLPPGWPVVTALAAAFAALVVHVVEAQHPLVNHPGGGAPWGQVAMRVALDSVGFLGLPRRRADLQHHGSCKQIV